MKVGKDDKVKEDNDKGDMTTRTIYYKYIMWGIKLKGLRRQADLSYSHKAMMKMVVLIMNQEH